MLCPRTCGKSENSCNLYRFTALGTCFLLHLNELEAIVEIARLVPTSALPALPLIFFGITTGISHPAPRRPLTRWPCQRSTAQQMNVQVKHRLPRAGANVQHSSIPALNLAVTRDLRRGKVTASDDLCVGSFRFFQSGEMPLGNNQNVSGRLRLNIFKGENVFVFINFLGGNIAANDATKKTIGIGHIESSPKTYHSRGRPVSAAGSSLV
jgi:hypothetical protein